jgi:coenzyme PQQ precursor peptide PqqA
LLDRTTFLMRLSCHIHPPLIVRLISRDQIQIADLRYNKETTMKTWFKPEITETEAGMEVTSYLPAELDRA